MRERQKRYKSPPNGQPVGLSALHKKRSNKRTQRSRVTGSLQLRVLLHAFTRPGDTRSVNLRQARRRDYDADPGGAQSGSALVRRQTRSTQWCHTQHRPRRGGAPRATPYWQSRYNKNKLVVTSARALQIQIQIQIHL
jgi:hypothetical protein